MAYKKSKGNQRTSKIEPSVQTMLLSVDIPTGTTVNSYCDLSQIASLANRRFYRQGINWAVAGFKVFNVSGISGLITVEKLPNTWVMSNAWEKSMRTWMKMNNEALAETESVRPRFLDFKIYADASHHNAGYASNLLPGTLAALATAGEWESSKLVMPLTGTPGSSTEFEFVAVGANYPGAGASGSNAVSLIEGYAASRGLPNILDPNTPDDASDAAGATPENWMVATFNEGITQDANVVADMIDQNNIAPYPFENDGVNGDTMYPGGANQLVGLQLHDTEYFTSTTISNTVRLKGGNFPCGLIKFGLTDSSPVGPGVARFTILVDLIPGSHRGYLCEPMTEM
jgi:hypothetical protein